MCFTRLQASSSWTTTCRHRTNTPTSHPNRPLKMGKCGDLFCVCTSTQCRSLRSVYESTQTHTVVLNSSLYTNQRVVLNSSKYTNLNRGQDTRANRTRDTQRAQAHNHTQNSNSRTHQLNRYRGIRSESRVWGSLRRLGGIGSRWKALLRHPVLTLCWGNGRELVWSMLLSRDCQGPGRPSAVDLLRSSHDSLHGGSSRRLMRYSLTDMREKCC